MMSKFKTDIVLFLIAAVILIASVLAFGVFGGCGIAAADGIAFADDTLSFEISTDDGNLWILSCDGGEISRFQGEFFDVHSSDAASVVFKRAMDETLHTSGKSDYTLNFVLPDIGYTVTGNSTFDYTQNTFTGFVVKSVFTPVISSDVQKALEYRSDDGKFERYAFSSEYDGGLSFGQNVNAGNYYVRMIVYEIFTFNDVKYNVPRYSPATFCKINKATSVAPEVAPISVEYGTAVKDIAGSVPSAEGTWSLSAEQSETDIINADTRLHVRDGGYKIKFDYTSRNNNYETLVGVELQVNVTPRVLRVYIGDVLRIAGDAPVEDFRYEITTPLVEGDTQNDLGITVGCDGLDANKAGTYVITASFENCDYVAVSVNYTNAFISGGKYAVYAARKTATAPDRVSVEVMLTEGFRDVELRIELYENEADGVRGYRIVFENSRGERVYPQSDFTLSWQDCVKQCAGTILSDGTEKPVVQTGDNYIIVDKDTDIVLLKASAPLAETMSAAEIASIVLAVLCGIAGAVLIVLIAVYFAKRRYLI